MRLLLACLCVAAAQQIEYSFSGEFTSQSATLNPASLDSSGVCDTSSSNYYYTTFNVTFATAGVRALHFFNLNTVSVVLSSAAYNLSNLCDFGNVSPLDYSTTGPVGSTYRYGHYFQAGTYTFIVASSSSSRFGGEVWGSALQGETVVNGVANKTWTPLLGETCGQSGNPAIYDTQVLWVNTSGYYNIFAAFARNLTLPSGYQIPDTPSITVLAGNLSDVNLTTLDCTTPNYVLSVEGSNANIFALNVWLAGNQTYTFVIQADAIYGGETYIGKYSIGVTPGRYYQFTNTTLFPRVDGCESTTSCQAEAGPGEAFALTTFTVPAGSFFLLWADQYDEDLRFYVYNGDNSIVRAACGLLTFSCVYEEDSISPIIYDAGSDTVFTIVATPWYQNTLIGSDGRFGVYIISGPNLVTPIAVSNAPSTSAPATAAPSSAPGTAAPATAAPAGSSAPSPPTTKGPGTSSAPSRAPNTSTNVSAVGLLHPCVFTVFALIGLLW